MIFNILPGGKRYINTSLTWDPNFDGVIIYCNGETYQNSFAAKPCVIGLIKVVHEIHVVPSNTTLIHGIVNDVELRCEVQWISPYSCSYSWTCFPRDVVHGCHGDLDTVRVEVNSTSSAPEFGRTVDVQCRVQCVANFSGNASAVLTIEQPPVKSTTTSDSSRTPKRLQKVSNPTNHANCDNLINSTCAPLVTLNTSGQNEDHSQNLSSFQNAELTPDIFGLYMILFGVLLGCIVFVAICWIVYKTRQHMTKKQDRNLNCEKDATDDPGYLDPMKSDEIAKFEISTKESNNGPNYDYAYGSSDWIVKSSSCKNPQESDNEYEELQFDTGEENGGLIGHYESIKSRRHRGMQSKLPSHYISDLSHTNPDLSFFGCCPQRPPLPPIEHCSERQQIETKGSDSPSPTFSPSPTSSGFSSSSSSPHLIHHYGSRMGGAPEGDQRRGSGEGTCNNGPSDQCHCPHTPCVHESIYRNNRVLRKEQGMKGHGPNYMTQMHF